MAKQIEFFYDYLSPFSYLADTQLPAIAQRTGAEIVYRPAFLGAIMKATGNCGPLLIQGKGNYNIVEFQRWAKRYGVPATFSPHFPFNTIRVLRAAIAAQMHGRFRAFHSAAFRAIWEQGQDLSKEDALRLTSRAGGNRSGADRRRRNQESAARQRRRGRQPRRVRVADVFRRWRNVLGKRSAGFCRGSCHAAVVTRRRRTEVAYGFPRRVPVT